MTDSLTTKLLAKPTAPVLPARQVNPDKDFSRQLEVTGSTASAVIRAPEGTVNEGTALAYLEQEGLNPSDWTVSGFRKSQWGSESSPMESVQFTFKRADAAQADRLPIDDLIAKVEDYTPPLGYDIVREGDYGYVIALGDMQFGKIDGDGVEGTLKRTIDFINKAADELSLREEQGYDIGHVHVAWLGDHIEGFVSQGGANTWRTPLTLNDQIRLTRRVMLHALVTIAPLCERLTMAAIPGNHGEPQRFEGKGVTRYDDSHDTESLIAVADAVALAPEKFEHVEFYVPETDELTVVLEVAGTTIAHAHGHQWRPGKHFDWWRGQAFNKDSAMHMADVLLAGHLHHEQVERDGHRLYVGAPALESESTWFRHATGTGGCPGVLGMLVKDGAVEAVDFIR